MKITRGFNKPIGFACFPLDLPLLWMIPICNRILILDGANLIERRDCNEAGPIIILNKGKSTLAQHNFRDLCTVQEPSWGILPTTYKALPKSTCF